MKTAFKYFLFIVLVIFTTLSLINCKKYPDDPTISFKSTKARYCGSWKINYIKINGTDFTQVYADSMGLVNMSDMRIDNSWGEGYQRGSKAWTSAYWLNGDNVIVDHPVIDSKTGIIWNSITKIRGNFSGAPLQRLYSDGSVFWKILRLYKGKMIIEKEKGSVKNEICYEKIK